MATTVHPFDELASSSEQQQYISLEHLRKLAETRQRALYADRTRDQFLFFSQVPKSDIAKVTDKCDPTYHLFRLTYDSENQILIVKIMASEAHELASREFEHCIYDELRAMGLEDQVYSLGTVAKTFGRWTKRADECWALAASPTSLQCVFEIGLSESESHLGLDAKGWLVSKNSTVKLVITMKVDRSSPQITVSRWELCERQSIRRTRNTGRTFLLPESIHEVTMYRQNATSPTQVSGTFILPFDKFFGRAKDPNNSNERDLSISTSRLQNLAEKVWKVQQLI